MTTCVQVVKRIRNNEQCTPSIRDPTNTVILMRFIMLMTHSTQHLFQTLIYIQTLQANESNWSSMFAQKRVLLLNVLRKVIWERVVPSIRLPPFKRVHAEYIKLQKEPISPNSMQRQKCLSTG